MAGDKKPRTHITAGQAATMLGVAARTISGWVDNDLIPGSYRLPKSNGGKGSKINGDRRISLHGLREFCRSHGIPDPAVLPEKPLYTVGLDVSFAAAMLARGPVTSAAGTHELCIRLAVGIPAAVLFNVNAIGRGQVMDCLKAMAGSQHKTLMVIEGDDDGSEQRLAYIKAGALYVFSSFAEALKRTPDCAWGKLPTAKDEVTAPKLAETA